jgi:hypothetical protein
VCAVRNHLPPGIRGARSGRVRWGGVVAIAVVASALAGCVLTEGDRYVVQPAPPNGIHVTLRPKTSGALWVLSKLVRAGGDADGWLRKGGMSTRCNYYRDTSYYGDRCAFRALREVRIAGSLERSWWGDAVNWDMFSDFRSSTMKPFRDNEARMSKGCAHVTIRNAGEWPIEWKNSNWTVRLASDPKC